MLTTDQAEALARIDSNAKDAQAKTAELWHWLKQLLKEPGATAHPEFVNTLRAAINLALAQRPTTADGTIDVDALADAIADKLAARLQQ